jgi:hemoglobin-like flavoprotein
MGRSSARIAEELGASDVDLVRRTLVQIDAHAEDVIRRFYELLFAEAPELRALFVRSTPNGQAQKFKETLYLIADHLEDEPWLDATLKRLGERHIDYGVTAEMYDPVARALVATLADALGAEWTEDVELAWVRAYAFVRDRMLKRA